MGVPMFIQLNYCYLLVAVCLVQLNMAVLVFIESIVGLPVGNL